MPETPLTEERVFELAASEWTQGEHCDCPAMGIAALDQHAAMCPWREGIEAFTRMTTRFYSERERARYDPITEGVSWHSEHLRPRPGELEVYIEMARANQHDNERLRHDLDRVSERERALRTDLETTKRELDRADQDCVEYRKALTRGGERERALRELIVRVDGAASALERDDALTEALVLVGALRPTDPAPSTTEGGPTDEDVNELIEMPRDLLALLRDPSIVIRQDAAVFELIAKWQNALSPTMSGRPTTEGVGGDESDGWDFDHPERTKGQALGEKLSRPQPQATEGAREGERPPLESWASDE